MSQPCLVGYVHGARQKAFKFDLLRNPAPVTLTGTTILDCEGMDSLSSPQVGL